ncbi:hypothetical protein CSKR_103563 [Clonorchis sinensis]|uniref:Uncharacterized protein n=1 Tax=Clonorchis sinensis TaxID=79923 RepID=A0A419PTV3_CLOSI|nr:hypothetical protein CSKR_103563 [Clonorchis sinensis]
MRRSGAAPSLAWEYDKRDIRLGSRRVSRQKKLVAEIPQQPTTGFALFGAHQIGTVLMSLLETKVHEISEIHLFANKFGFTRDSPRTQLNLSFVMLTETRGLRLPDEP